MTPEQAAALVAGDYVAYLGSYRPIGFRVSKAVQTSVGMRIVVPGLYGDSWADATSFVKVRGSTLTKAEILAFDEERDRSRAVRTLGASIPASQAEGRPDLLDRAGR